MKKSQHTADLHGMVSHNYYIMRRSSCVNRVIGYHRRKENQKGSYQSTKKIQSSETDSWRRIRPQNNNILLT